MGGLANVLISRHSDASVNYYGAMPRRRLLTALPDITLVCSVLAAVAFDVFIPLVILYSAMWLKVLACGAIAVLIVLGVGMLRNLRSAGATTNAGDSPGVLITTGYYSRSRNPYYLVCLLLLGAVAFALGSVSAFVAPIIYFIVMNVVVIPAEERILRHRFGSEYDDYMHRTHRWLSIYSRS